MGWTGYSPGAIWLSFKGLSLQVAGGVSDVRPYVAGLSRDQRKSLLCLKENTAKLAEPCTEVVSSISGHLADK